ncbi:peptidoglycan-binding domain-containing protein [Pseudomonas sp. A014]|uniref:peptidoglycan-binding domain-containing protein n=1 Tax=Pseudomonas sp. A014 TaxID=3458058 RepID=UPI0040373B8B
MRPVVTAGSACTGLLILVLMYTVVVSLRQAVMPEQDAAGPGLKEQAPALSEVCERLDGHAFAALGTRVTRDLQRMLAEQVYYRQPLDGCVGSATQQALYRYQRDNGLAATGAINAPTLTHLGIPVPAWLLHHKEAPATPDSAQSLSSSSTTP